jgi:hypothetical protein
MPASHTELWPIFLAIVKSRFGFTMTGEQESKSGRQSPGWNYENVRRVFEGISLMSRLAGARGSIRHRPVLNQHRLQFALRGGEYAFAINHGDFEALEDVASRCCDFWNGANSLIISVDDNPEFKASLDHVTATRDVERVFIHSRVTEQGRLALQERFGARLVPMNDFGLRLDFHPLNLQPSFRDPPEDGPRIVLPVPVYEPSELSRVGIVTFGRIDDEARDGYSSAFVIQEHPGSNAHGALLSSQISCLSPLAQSTHLMNMYRQTGPYRVRRLVVVDGNNFEHLISFWNLRARSVGQLGSAAVVAVPYQALSTPEQLHPLVDWNDEAGYVIKPDLLVVADDEHRDALDAALQALGFRSRGDDAQVTEFYGDVAEDRRQLEFAYTRILLIGGPMRRGVFTEQLVNLNPGRNIVRFEPKGFETRYAGGQIRLDILSWPMPFIPSQGTAARVHPHASVDQGVLSILTAATNHAYVFDLVVPAADDALRDFLSDRGLGANPSAAGRYTQALIGRLGGPQRLEALASEEALGVLNQLTSLSRLKLVQRLRGMLTEKYGNATPATEDLVEAIRGEVIALDLPAPSLSDLSTQSGIERLQLVTALESLIDVGFVKRGRSERCPECGYKDFYPLEEINERISCHACRQSFVLAVSSGPDEPRLAYQLDPLMARAMDQDLLPVLLTLRHLCSPEGGASGAFWPGLEIVRGGDLKQDCDILLAQDGRVIVCECKRTASTLSIEQARATLALASELDAATVFAALDGQFLQEVKDLAPEPALRLLTRAQLVLDSS